MYVADTSAGQKATSQSYKMAAFDESDLEKHLGGGEEEEASSKVDFISRFGMSFQKRIGRN